MAIRRHELLAILNHIQASVPERHRSPELSDEALLSPYHLQRVFQSTFGESPKKLSRRLRMERAAAYLVHSRRPISDIGAEVGFESPAGFTRAFAAFFGESPRAFRKHHQVARPESKQAVQQSVSTGPCVRLYRRPHQYWQSSAGERTINNAKEQIMAYDISREERPATNTLMVSRRVSMSAVADTLGEILPKVFEFGTSKGAAFIGPPFARYTDWSAGGVTLAGGMPVADPIEDTDEIQAAKIPAGSYAKTIHVGTYDNLDKAHEAIEQWINEQGLRPGAASYEIYHTDPGQYPNEEDWRTEVLREISG
jgi:AraC family transcriptional regulator